jgi:hemolysin activation/secretion protein
MPRRARAVACCAWLALTLPTSAALAQAPAAAPTSTVSRFQVSGNTLLEPGLIDATLQPYVGLRSIDELRGAAAAVQRLYGEAGYGGVVAYLPPQTGTDGTVTIIVLEGKLAAVDVRGATVFSEDAVRARVPALALGTTPRLPRVDSQIAIANENPARRIQVLLKPGQRAGEIAAELAVQDRPLQTMTFGADDTGSPRTGRYRAGLTWQHANASGNDDVLTAQYQTSPSKPGQVTVISAAYRYPLPAQLLVIDGYAAYSDVDAGTSDTAAGSVRINGRGNLAGLRATWHLPRLGDVDQRLGLALDRREYLNSCEVGGAVSGACGPAGVNVAVTPLSLDYSLRAGGPVTWTAGASLLSNLKLGGHNAEPENFAALRPGATESFTALRASASFAAVFAQSWQLRGRAALQWSGDALVSGEQFGLGGAVSVRGYEERELVGDRGLLASLELVGPEMLTRLRADAPSLRLFAFVDGGVVSNVQQAPCRGDATRCPLASAGLGITFERDRLQARVAAATALKEGSQTLLHDTRAHFTAIYSF